MLTLVYAGFTNLVNAAEVTFVQSAAELTFGMYAMQNGTGHDLKMQLSAPMSAGWGAVGIGGEMKGALMFMIYPSSNSKDVTVSVRSATGNVKPQELKGVEYTVEKTSIMDGTMMAQLTCHQCDSWKGGMLDMTDANAPWMYALGPNSPVHSDDQNTESIQQHQKYNNQFYVNMPNAMTMMQDPTFSSMLPTANKDASTSMDMKAGMMSTSSSSSSSSSSKSSGPSDYKQLVIAHAVLLGLSFAFLMPLAVLLLRVAGRYSFWLHAGIQSLAIMALLAGFPIAIYFSASGDEFNSFTQAHQIIGIIAVSASILFQPALGWYHHIRYKKIGRRTIFSHVHMWIGRLTPLLGIINIILGCLLSGHVRNIAIGTGTAALFLYVVIFSFAAWRGYSKKGSKKSDDKHVESSPDMSQRS
ncbi:MAG: hypothetical protein M1828_003872 [Chrysothrix sp. TS-e1954]|nr:MAG: hypothetical protein M1828_003872 [Chrysothrix sp. TS-e1954]